MNSRERVLAAMDRRRADVVPIHHIGFSSDVASAILGREAFVGGGIQQWREATALWQGPDAHEEFVERSYQDAIAVARACDNDIIRARYWSYNRRPTRRIDGNTFLYEYGPEEDWRVLRYDPRSEQCDVSAVYPPPPATFDSIEREIAAAESALEDYAPGEATFAQEVRARREHGDEFEIRVGGVEVGLPLRGIEIWLEALVLRPDLIARHLDVAVERARRNVAYLAPLGFRHFWGGLDFASNEGPMFSPRLFRELIAPRLRQVTECCHQHNAYHLFASDGEFWSVTDTLFGEGTVDGYFEIDGRAGMDLRRLRAAFPNLILIGNVSSHTVHLGSREEIVDEVLACLEVARSSPGVIAGVSNYFVPHTPVDNVLTVIDTLRANR